MGKQKQQVISRFFAAEPKPGPSNGTPATPPPKITTTVDFSPAKRLKTQHHLKTLRRDADLPLPNPTLHRKFLSKLLEPPQELLEPSRNPNLVRTSYTPLEQQIVELKKQHKDVLLMVEVGYKYRFFGEDAENAARILGIYAHMDHNFLTASVPTFRMNFHVRRLVNAGYKVGVVKQTETAAIKAHGSNKSGPFCRGLSALYTKATLEANGDFGEGEEKCGLGSNYLLCVVEEDEVAKDREKGVRIGALAVEVSTGDVVYGDFLEEFTRNGLEAMILKLAPVELLVKRPISKQTEKLLLAYAGPVSNLRMEYASPNFFSENDALAETMSLHEGLDEYDLANKEKRLKDMPKLVVQALALTVLHLKQFGYEKLLCMEASFRPFSCTMEMTLSSNALQQLEVLKNNHDGSVDGSLFHCMNRTLSLFGSRLFRHWVTHPLCDRSMINARLDAVSEILESMGSSSSNKISTLDYEESSEIVVLQPESHEIISSVLIALGGTCDVQRGITRIFHRTASPSEFIAVIHAILVAGKQLSKLLVEEDKGKNNQQVRSVLLRKLILTASSSTLVSAAANLLSPLNKEAALRKDLHNIFTGGKFPEIVSARSKIRSTNEKLDQLLYLYRKLLRLSDLDFVSVSGVTHLIELSTDVKVPSDWVKVNSTKKTIRYHSPEVLTLIDQLNLANEELSILCRTTWNSFLKTFAEHYSEFQAAVQALATLDCLHSIATLSRAKNYVRPVFVSDDDPPQINISSGRHPVMEGVLLDNFVPNDTHLHADTMRCQIITGPNMGGKSCYIRQVAILALMAQIGCFVPASSAKLHVIDGIYTRMGASDSIQQGRSTFLEELSEASHILQQCTHRSLVIMDELGRGTSTHDGVAIAYATLHHLLKHKRSMVLFVTHYPEVTEIMNEFPVSVGAYHVSYLTSEKRVDKDMENSTDDDGVTYLYKVVPGVCETSFGFKVAHLAQLPPSCIKRGVAMASKLEAEVRKREARHLCGKHSVSMGQLQAEDLGICEEIYREFFFHLNLALMEEDDTTKRLHELEHAKSLARKLLTK